MAEDTTVKRTRASGEVLDYLLREFENNHNPSPELRKDISDRTGMSEKAVRIWFQNRRAKLRKFERMGKPVNLPALSSPVNGIPSGQRSYANTASGHSSRSNLLTNISASGLRMQSSIPIELNEKYCFIDCLSLSVGSWQRIISGHHEPQALHHQLINLSPFTLNTVMNNVDLMVILSRKNLEINYFFSAISNNSKILFRIFYPISSVISCLLLDNNINKENNELRLNLSRKPKFSVYFFNGVNANLNQWSICDDFSEGQQVSSAYYAQGGTSTPHVLVGVKNSLQFLNTFITENNQLQHQHYVPASSNLTSNDTPQSSYSVAGDLPVNNMMPDSKDFILDEETANNANFQIKHERWEDSPRSELEYRMKGLSPIPNFNGNSPGSLESHHSHSNKTYTNGRTKLSATDINKKEPGQYEEMFGSATSDFFSTVQTPNSNLLNAAVANRDNENLINSPSTNMQAYGNNEFDKHHSPRSDANNLLELRFRRGEQDLNFDGLSDTQGIYNAGSGEPAYDFDIQQENSGDFQASDLIVNSPAVSNSAGTPNANGALVNHVDNFIDYNAHY
ncbi:CIC11C00000004915 [Sungouiella intermedia]|uniref:CIC11C00000004915 n=1 Tax=Sungouiella intermedia TaxID=45354 RepID=A0A1L0BLU5_9ASCO|nr:CIC11C00000004915 [[Candida] intermedia]